MEQDGRNPFPRVLLKRTEILVESNEEWAASSKRPVKWQRSQFNGKNQAKRWSRRTLSASETTLGVRRAGSVC